MNYVTGNCIFIDRALDSNVQKFEDSKKKLSIGKLDDSICDLNLVFKRLLRLRIEVIKAEQKFLSFTLFDGRIQFYKCF